MKQSNILKTLDALKNAIEAADNRALENDGPVSKTWEEMSSAELKKFFKQVWELCKENSSLRELLSIFNTNEKVFIVKGTENWTRKYLYQ